VARIKKIYYNKLVRDKIPQIIGKSGGTAEFKKLNLKEFQKELFLKVGEEASALPFVKTKSEIISELADIFAVTDEIMKLKKIKTSDIKNAMKANFVKKGGFEKRLFLVWSQDTGYRTNERRNSKRK